MNILAEIIKMGFNEPPRVEVDRHVKADYSFCLECRQWSNENCERARHQVQVYVGSDMEFIRVNKDGIRQSLKGYVVK